jgi:hypothetical protein
MLAKFGYYILFLVTLVAYLVAIVVVAYKQAQTLSRKKGNAFLLGQWTQLAGVIPIIVIPWILAGFFSKSFTFAILIAFEASALLIYLLYSTFRIAPREVMNNIYVWTEETKVKHPRLLFAQQMLSLIILLGYFVGVTYIYFAYPRNSDPSIQGILGINMALYLFLTLFVSVPTVLQLSSPDVSNAARRALFVQQAAGALQMGVILTLSVGLIGVRLENWIPQALRLPPSYLQYLPMVLLLVFYLLIIIIPYFVGLEGRRRKEIMLYGSILNRISRVIDAVGVPGAEDQNQLTQLQLEFKKETDVWIETEPIFELLAQSANQTLPYVQTVFEDYKAQDPRVTNLTAMESLNKKIDEVLAEYGRIQPQANEFELHIELNRAVENHLRDQRQHYEGMIKSAEDVKILAPMLARLAAVVGAVPIVMQYGQKLVAIVSASQ